MKLLAVVAILFVYCFAAWQQSHYREILRPKLVEQATADLKAAGYPVSVQVLDGMDAELTGAVPEPSDRIKAQAIVDQIPGLRAPDSHNYLKVPGKVVLRLEPGSGELRFSGRLGNAGTTQKLVESLQNLKNVDAVSMDELGFEDIVIDPTYLDSPAFLKLAAAFFEIPGNGTLIATEAGLQLKGLATAKLAESWKAAEREMGSMVKPGVLAAASRMTDGGGGEQFHVKADVVLHPSELHVPSRHPEAPLKEDRLAALTGVLHQSEIQFAPGSFEIRPEQNGKLEQAAKAMQAVGSRVKFVVGGHFQVGDASGALETVARNRAGAVAGNLSGLGVPP
ncbi:MAG: hypothetical protein ABL994_23255, partial [Verrucomicrobiales bacterium]